MKNMQITFNRFDNINEDATDKEYLVVRIEIKNEIIGELRIDEEDGQIEYVEILTEYRGKGFYKMLLISSLQEVDELVSNDRNKYSNSAYRKWMNDENLGSEDTVYITLSDESLNFTN